MLQCPKLQSKLLAGKGGLLIKKTYKIKNNKIQQNVTLNKNTCIFISDTPLTQKHTKNKYEKISSSSQRHFKFCNGSLTVETALVLPIFLFVFISLLYFLVVIQYTNCVLEGVHQTAKDMAIKSYAISKNINSTGYVGSVALSETYVRANVNKYLTNVDMKTGSINYIKSTINNDLIDIIAEEKIQIPYSFLGNNRFFLLERVYIHPWTGYNESTAINPSTNSSEELVYITSSGSVYHKNRNCSHLKVNPKPISNSELLTKRNVEGGKYYPCEYCRPTKSSRISYITDFGNRYHSSMNCGAITRDIHTIKISEAGSRRACRDCG